MSSSGTGISQPCEPFSACQGSLLQHSELKVHMPHTFPTMAQRGAAGRSDSHAGMHALLTLLAGSSAEWTLVCRSWPGAYAPHFAVRAGDMNFKAGRTGDCSTATLDEQGNVWLVATSLASFHAYVAHAFVSAELHSCAGVGQVHVPHMSQSELVATNFEAGAPLRTGDYSTATLDEQGSVWLVAEYASSRNASAASGSGLNAQAVIGLNWGTWLMQLDASLA